MAIWALALGLSAMAGCGKKESNSKTSSVSYTLPDIFRGPPTVSPVPVGSLDIISSPDPGSYPGNLLIRLLSEPGAVIHYSLEPLDDPSGAEEYRAPLSLAPPFTIRAVASKDGRSGPVREFAFTADANASLDASDFVSSSRLVGSGTIHPVKPLGELASFAAVEAPIEGEAAIVIDGQAADWDALGPSRSRSIDLPHDVPDVTPHLDIDWIQATEDGGAFYFAAHPREAPRAEQGVAYGFEIGPSHISFASFGPGTDYVYRLEVQRGQVYLFEPGADKPLPFASQPSIALGAIVELKVAKDNLPKLDGVRDLAVRPYTAENIAGTVVRDRLLPVFLRSTFGMLRSSSEPRAGRPLVIDFFADPKLMNDDFVTLHSQLSHALVPALEGMNQIPITSLAEIPLFFTAKDEEGYSGLNATDRGILSTLGPGRGEVATAQLMAHELAHYQNAAFSSITAKWLQEGMSEWSAERALYQFYPRKAAYDYLKSFRVEPYFRIAADPTKTPPLDSWQDDVPEAAYEKAYMFLALLERRVGVDALRKAFQTGFNQRMDSQGFKSFLERETGRNLDDLFSFWVFEGNVAAKNNPQMLFQDGDHDGLLALDEEQLGTDDERFDTDGDGYLDGEEFFLRRDPMTSQIDADGALVGTKAIRWVDETVKEPMPMFRLGGDPEASFVYSYALDSSTPSIEYVGPEFLRPPYSLRIQAVGGAAPTVIDRPVYLPGATTAQSTPWPSQSLYPPTAVTTMALPDAGDLTEGTSLGLAANDSLVASDFRGDLPAAFSGYDIVKSRIERTGDTFIITLTTAGKPDPLGQWGDFSLAFVALTWAENGRVSGSQSSLLVSGGTTYWSDQSGASEKAPAGIKANYGATLQIEIAASRLSKWLKAAGSRQVCLRSRVAVSEVSAVTDQAGCLTWIPESTITQRLVYQKATPYGGGVNTVEWFTKSGVNLTRSQELAKFALQAIDTFSLVLGRPLWERNIWPVFFDAPTSALYGLEGVESGLFISSQDASFADFNNYFMVEGLARVHLGDLIRHNTNPNAEVWVQSVYVNWLTLTALHQIYPTTDLINRTHAWIDDYLNVDNNFWRDGIASDTKALMFSIFLDAKLGPERMARVFSTFSNRLPSAAEFKSLLIGSIDFNGPMVTTSAIDGWWSTWVEGTDDDTDRAAVEAEFAPSDIPGLYEIEAEKVKRETPGTSSYP